MDYVSDSRKENMMYSESLVKLGKVRSEIREIFEYGNKRKAEIGAENVFDFSIGNPSVPAPKIVDDTIMIQWHFTATHQHRVMLM